MSTCALITRPDRSPSCGSRSAPSTDWNQPLKRTAPTSLRRARRRRSTTSGRTSRADSCGTRLGPRVASPERFDVGGFAVKPAPIGGFDNVTSTETIDDLIALGIRIRAEQDTLPRERRIWIGGEFWLTVLKPGSFSQVLVHRFDDWRRPLDRHERAAGLILRGRGAAQCSVAPTDTAVGGSGRSARCR